MSFASPGSQTERVVVDSQWLSLQNLLRWARAVAALDQVEEPILSILGFASHLVRFSFTDRH